MSAVKAFWVSVAALVALIIVGTVVGFGLGWFGKAADVVSANNTEKQYTVVIGHYNSLIVAAENACDAQKAAPKSTPGTVMVENPSLAYGATYRRIAGDYKSSIDNPFEGKIVKPEGYPTSAQLDAIDTKDWCTVAPQVRALHQ